MNLISDQKILSNLPEYFKLALQNLFYLDEFCEQIRKNHENIDLLMEEIFDYLKEANLFPSKKLARLFITNFITNLIKENREITEENDEENEENNDENEDFWQLNGENEGKSTEGLCEVCFSQKNLTLHHAIPKLMIKRLFFLSFLR